jgi:beta-galactosidase
MELITPTTAKVLAYYDHPVWGKYAAITQNNYGKGLATYIGCWISNEVTGKIMEDAVKKAGLWGEAQMLSFPIITKQGVNEKGKMVHYIFNYAPKATTITYPFASGQDLLMNQVMNKNSTVEIEPWGIKIIEEF